MKTVGPGVREIRTREDSGASRVICGATLPDAVLVLHASQTKTQATPRRDIDLAASIERMTRVDVQMFDSVFDALADTPAEAANMKARSELLSVLKARIRSREMSQEAAAGRLGITRPRLNDLLQGKIAKFSLDALVNLATASGLTVHVHVHVAEAA